MGPEDNSMKSSMRTGSEAELRPSSLESSGVYIDGALYPDLDSPPAFFASRYDQADHLHRVVTGWDFGLTPKTATIKMLQGWKDIFDEFPVALSPGYHAFRSMFGWEAVPVPPGTAAPEPLYLRLDRSEGRPDDPCEGKV